MRRLRLLLLSFLLLLLTAAANAQTLRKQYPDAAPFADIVWKVRSSKQVQVGMIYVFLSDGTLAMTSRNSKPAFGEWMFKKGCVHNGGRRAALQSHYLEADTHRVSC